MIKPIIKHLRSFITIMTLCLGLSLQAGNTVVCDDPDDDIIINEGSSNGNPSGNRSVTIPIQASYNSFTCIVSVLFTQNLGVISTEIENTTTGEYYSYLTDSSLGGDAFLLSGTSGHYTITFTLANGTEYIGEWEL